ncbi:hypothetical protein FQA39_LY10463 [Lamprigera yunnana]|nr:hypothetical protein FQA39_LY10463 [Lamprigera yunnana]
MFCMLGVLLFMLEKVLLDVELEKHIQEKDQKRIKLFKQGGKLYINSLKPYWTKAVVLRSAVGRLHEELSALEFDASPEAVYRLKKYYTVRECEQLQNKYKMGQKICTKFLQEIYCVSCLIAHLKKAGLEQFLDTAKEHIKDYSDSDASSDDECKEEDSDHANTTKEEEKAE